MKLVKQWNHAKNMSSTLGNKITCDFLFTFQIIVLFFEKSKKKKNALKWWKIAKLVENFSCYRLLFELVIRFRRNMLTFVSHWTQLNICSHPSTSYIWLITYRFMKFSVTSGDKSRFNKIKVVNSTEIAMLISQQIVLIAVSLAYERIATRHSTLKEFNFIFF